MGPDQAQRKRTEAEDDEHRRRHPGNRPHNAAAGAGECACNKRGDREAEEISPRGTDQLFRTETESGEHGKTDEPERKVEDLAYGAISLPEQCPREEHEEGLERVRNGLVG